MAKEGLLASLCAGCLLLAGQFVGIAVAADDAGNVTTALSVQTALQQGRDQLLHGNPRGAVYVLESQLPRINGNREYFEAAVRDLAMAQAQFPGWIARLLTHPVKGLDNYRELIDTLTNARGAIKVFMEIAPLND